MRTTYGESYYRTDNPEWFDVAVGDFREEPFELIEEETIDLSRSYFVEQGDQWTAENGYKITDFWLFIGFTDKFREDLRQHLLVSLNDNSSDDNINTPVPIPASLYLFVTSFMTLFGFRVRKKSTV